MEILQGFDLESRRGQKSADRVGLRDDATRSAELAPAQEIPGRTLGYAPALGARMDDAIMGDGKTNVPLFNS